MLAINKLYAGFEMNFNKVFSVEDFSLNIHEGSIVGLVGESGAGKSTVGLSILDLLKFKNGKIFSGEIIFNDKEILSSNNKYKESLRGNQISMIFQEPFSYFNPSLKIKTQVMESMFFHKKIYRKEALKNAEEVLKKLDIKNEIEKLNSYPFELSGGQLQRIMIGMAIINNPKLIIADEPTTALDSLTQEIVFNFLTNIVIENKASILLISHDLPLVSKYADYIAVMYLGKVVEYGKTDLLIKNPMHPYTKALFSSFRFFNKWEKINTIKGDIPNISSKPSGCYFHPRCEKVLEKCKNNIPIEFKKNNEHKCYCFNPDL